MTNAPTLTLLQTGAGGLMDSLPMLAAIFLIFYFLLIRPQNRERRKLETMRAALKKGDRVLTQGGFIGTVHQVKDNGELVLELESDTRARVVRDAIVRVLDGSARKGAKDEAKGNKAEAEAAS